MKQINLFSILFLLFFTIQACQSDDSCQSVDDFHRTSSLIQDCSVGNSSDELAEAALGKWIWHSTNPGLIIGVDCEIYAGQEIVFKENGEVEFNGVHIGTYTWCAGIMRAGVGSGVSISIRDGGIFHSERVDICNGVLLMSSSHLADADSHLFMRADE